MNFKKFISGVSALTIAASAFAAMAVTASAATYPALNSVKPFNNTTGTVAVPATATRWGFAPALETNEVAVVEFDLYVADGDKVELTFTNSSSEVGARFIFDASAKDGNTYVSKDDNGTVIAINKNTSYDRYETGKTAHVLIQSYTTADSDHIQSHDIWVSNVGSRVLTNRTAKGARDIDARNMKSGKTWQGLKLEGSTVNDTIASKVSGGVAYIKGVAATKIDVFESDEAAAEDTVTAFGADMENLSGKLNIKVDDTVATCDTVLTNANVKLGIVAPGEHDAAVVRVY